MDFRELDELMRRAVLGGEEVETAVEIIPGILEALRP